MIVGRNCCSASFFSAVNRLLVVLGFFQAEIVLQAAAHGVVQRELQRLIAPRLRRHAAEKGIGRRSRIRRLRPCSRAGQKHSCQKIDHSPRRKHKIVSASLTTIIISDEPETRQDSRQHPSI